MYPAFPPNNNSHSSRAIILGFMSCFPSPFPVLLTPLVSFMDAFSFLVVVLHVSTSYIRVSLSLIKTWFDLAFQPLCAEPCWTHLPRSKSLLIWEVSTFLCTLTREQALSHAHFPGSNIITCLGWVYYQLPSMQSLMALCFDPWIIIPKWKMEVLKVMLHFCIYFSVQKNPETKEISIISTVFKVSAYVSILLDQEWQPCKPRTFSDAILKWNYWKRLNTEKWKRIIKLSRGYNKDKVALEPLIFLFIYTKTISSCQH